MVEQLGKKFKFPDQPFLRHSAKKRTFAGGVVSRSPNGSRKGGGVSLRLWRALRNSLSRRKNTNNRIRVSKAMVPKPEVQIRIPEHIQDFENSN